MQLQVPVLAETEAAREAAPRVLEAAAAAAAPVFSGGVGGGRK